MSNNTFLLFLLSALVPFAFILINYRLNFYVYDQLVNPSFEMRPGRFFVLSISFFIFAVVILLTFDLFRGHFHVSILDNNCAFILPSFLYLFIRGTVRFHSSRVASEHLNTLSFLVMVFASTKIGYAILSANHAIDISVPIASYGTLVLVALILPTIGDVIFHSISRITKIKEHISEIPKLIDLMEQLPINIEFMFGKDNIDKKIAQIISKGSGDLLLITKTYSTVAMNIPAINDRIAKTDRVKILGDKDVYEDYMNADEEIRRNILHIESAGLHFCTTHFDGIRLIVDCSKRVLLSFATSRWSHVAIYSEHPFTVALFSSYFETKCRTINCEAKCEVRGTTEKC